MGTTGRGREGVEAGWPPTAEPQGIDLSTGAVLGILAVMVAMTHAVWTLTVGRPFTVVGWIWEPTTAAVMRQEIATPIVELIFWALIISALGWTRASGLVIGRASAWGVVPLALFWTATLMAAGLTNVIEKGGGFIALAVVGVFLSALTEEIAFRGFLYHGLTRTLGGAASVLVGSALFALMHLPVEIWGRNHAAGIIVGALLSHFCFGVVMCRIRAATRAVWFPAGVHALWNVTTIGIGFWSFPEVGDAPKAFLLLTLGLDLTGLFLAYGLVMRDRWRMARTNVAVMMQLRAAERAPATAIAGAPVGRSRPAPTEGASGTAPVFERFTAAARLAVVLAQEEARVQRDPAIGTEHLLLALVGDPTWVPARALERLGVDPRSPSGRRERLMDEEDAAAEPSIPFTPRAKLAIALAIAEADRLGHPDVGPEHLFLGVVADRRAEAARVLRRLGLSAPRVRRAVLESIEDGSAGGASIDGSVPAPPD